jgi:hypothetical protein
LREFILELLSYSSAMLRRVVSNKLADVLEVLIDLLMEAVSTKEISVYFNETTRRSIPENSHLRE